MRKAKLILGINDLSGEIIDVASKEILKYTPQLFLKKGKEPQPIASSILISLKNYNFLITAAHALNKINLEEIGIFFDHTFHILNGEVCYTDVTVSDTNNKIDLAVFKLNKDVVQDIKKKYDFFILDGYNFDHENDKKPQYLLVGYPETKTKKKPAHLIFKVTVYLSHYTCSNKEI